MPAPDQHADNARYYAAHRDAELNRVRARQDAALKFLRELRRVPCDDCGQTFAPHMMDFDHRDPRKKLFAITTAGSRLKSQDALIAEIEKCDIVCANCHALRTYAALMERRMRSTPDEWAPGKSPRIASQSARGGAQTWRCSTTSVTFHARIAAGDSFLV